ncbi:hypothetical protein HPP92_026654 [Vanilla planifolia]|uniref:VQ domain-containing protein n=1 Tax=Vanilla planifolia TaxID=51239 RepID=A0A835PEK5_VANPL|nr:hypothetical protein HPP92_026654 [Vanilla planifolia]
MESTEARPRRPPTTVWNRTEPTPPRVYRTDPKGFRRLVQELTGKPKETTSTPSPDFPARRRPAVGLRRTPRWLVLVRNDESADATQF